MNKFKILGGILLSGIAVLSNAQVKTQSNTEVSIARQNPFLDASGYTKDANKSLGKGLYFPQTDLTQWVFDTSMVSRSNFTTAFDGLIVYNTVKGTVNADETQTSTKGQKVDVEPGFYYFFNPTGGNTRTVNAGKWVRIGGGASTSVAGANVATGTFTHAGGIQAVLGDNVPTDLKAITGIKIVRVDDNGAKLEGGVAATTFYSYDKATRTIAFGQGVMATSMPKGEYHYTIEYTK